MIIGIDMGHSINAGAAALLNETTENRKIGKRVIELLKANGHTVIDCTVDAAANANAQLAAIVQKANSQRLDIFCSIHLNAGGGHGTETYIYSGSYIGKENNRAIAVRVNNAIANSCNFRNRGVKEDCFYVLKNTKAAAILIEVCFVDSSEDKQKLNTEKVAVAICEGLTGKKITTAIPATTKETYRVRKSWSNAASQKGAFGNLSNAKKCCDQNPGYSVYNSKGEAVYTVSNKAIAAGAKVKVTGSKYATGQTIPTWVKEKVHTVKEINSNKVLLLEINSWVYLQDLKMA